MQCVDGVVDRASRGKGGAVIFGIALSSTAMFGNLWCDVVLADQNIGKAFVVTQQHIKRGRRRLIKLASSSKASVSVLVVTNSMLDVSWIMRRMRFV